MKRCFFFSALLFALLYNACAANNAPLVNCSDDIDCSSGEACLFGFCRDENTRPSPDAAAGVDVGIRPDVVLRADVESFDVDPVDAENADVVDAGAPDVVELGFDPDRFSQSIRLRLYMARELVDVENAVVVLDLTSIDFDFTQAQAEGQDIRVFDPQSGELLSYEREAYSQDDARGFLWIKIPLAEAGINDQVITIFSGNESAADGEERRSVWNDYLLVSHFEDGALTNSAGAALLTGDVVANAGAWGEGIILEDNATLSFEEPIPESFTVQMYVDLLGAEPNASLIRSEGNATINVVALDAEATFSAQYQRVDESVETNAFSLVDRRFLSVRYNSDDISVLADGNVVASANVVDFPFSAPAIEFGEGVSMEIDELRIRRGESSLGWERVHERARDGVLFVREPVKELRPLADRIVQRTPEALVHFEFNADDNLLVDEAGTIDAIAFDPNATERFREGVRLKRAQTLEAEAPILRSTLLDSGAYSVEVWVRPDHAIQNGPARIVTLSRGSSDRTFTLGQLGSAFVIRAHTSLSDNNGTLNNEVLRPSITLPRGDDFVHVVATFADESLSLYVNGQGVTVPWPGVLEIPEEYRFAIGNEVESARPWLGDISLLAIYPRALSEEEINVNFAAGP